MGRTVGSKNGISTTPGYTAIGQKAQDVPAGYKKVLRRYAGRAGGPMHLRYEYVVDEDATNSSSKADTSEEEPEEETAAEEQQEVAKKTVAKGPDNAEAKRVEEVKARQKVAAQEYAKHKYKLEKQKLKAQRDRNRMTELQRTVPTAQKRINSAYDAQDYKSKRDELNKLLQEHYAKRTQGAPTINSAYDLANYKKKKK